MESNWRWNISDLGMVGMGFDWCAHVLGNPNPFVYLCKYPGVNNGATMEVRPSLGIWSLLSPSIFHPPGQKFPWAFTVEPDHT